MLTVLKNTINLIILRMEQIYFILALIAAILLIKLRNATGHKRDVTLFLLAFTGGIILMTWLYTNFWWQTLLGCLVVVLFSVWEANHYAVPENENII